MLGFASDQTLHNKAFRQPTYDFDQGIQRILQMLGDVFERIWSD